MPKRNKANCHKDCIQIQFLFLKSWKRMWLEKHSAKAAATHAAICSWSSPSLHCQAKLTRKCSREQRWSRTTRWTFLTSCSCWFQPLMANWFLGAEATSFQQGKLHELCPLYIFLFSLFRKESNTFYSKFATTFFTAKWVFIWKIQRKRNSNNIINNLINSSEAPMPSCPSGLGPGLKDALKAH